jgi:hypothetical protein
MTPYSGKNRVPASFITSGLKSFVALRTTPCEVRGELEGEDVCAIDIR